MSLSENAIHTKNDDEKQPVKAVGKVTDVFGHRFVVETHTGKLLADIGPKSSITVKSSDKVEIEGEKKRTEIKVRRISVNGGDMRETEHGGGKHEHDEDHKHEGPFGPKEAHALALDAGYKVSGELRRYKKHFEASAMKDGRPVEIHIHQDGVREH